MTHTTAILRVVAELNNADKPAPMRVICTRVSAPEREVRTAVLDMVLSGILDADYDTRDAFWLSEYGWTMYRHQQPTRTPSSALAVDSETKCD